MQYYNKFGIKFWFKIKVYGSDEDLKIRVMVNYIVIVENKFIFYKLFGVYLLLVCKVLIFVGY